MKPIFNNRHEASITPNSSGTAKKSNWGGFASSGDISIGSGVTSLTADTTNSGWWDGGAGTITNTFFPPPPQEGPTKTEKEITICDTCKGTGRIVVSGSDAKQCSKCCGSGKLVKMSAVVTIPFNDKLEDIDGYNKALKQAEDYLNSLNKAVVDETKDTPDYSKLDKDDIIKELVRKEQELAELKQDSASKNPGAGPKLSQKEYEDLVNETFK